MTAGPRGPTAGLTVETLAALADQYLDEHVPQTTVPTTRPGLVHDFAAWLAPRLPGSPGAPAAARRAPTDAMIDAALEVLIAYAPEPGDPLPRTRVVVERALRAALAAARP